MGSIYQHDRYGQGTAYWRMVHQKMDQILADNPASRADGDFYTTSNENEMRGIKAGVTFECSLKRAAEDICNGTHRLATNAEIANYKENLGRRTQSLFDLNEGKKNTMVMKTSQAETDRLATLVSAAVTAALAQTSGKPQQKGA